jgi:hypothetical protein
LKACSSDGPGIGTGTDVDGATWIENITICNSMIEACSKVKTVIGSPFVGFLCFSGICLIVCDGEVGVNASSLVFSDASLAFITNGAPLFGLAPSHQGVVDVVIAYCAVTSKGSERLSPMEGPYVNVGSLSIPDGVNRSSVDFCVRKGLCSGESPFERCFVDRDGQIRSIIAQSAREGRYSFSARIDGQEGNFLTLDRSIDFAIDLTSSFIDILFLERDPPTCYFHPTGTVRSDRSRDVHSFDPTSTINIVISNEMNATEAVPSKDLRSTGGDHWTLFSFDLINSINIVDSSEMIESDQIGSFSHFVQCGEGARTEELRFSAGAHGKRLSSDFANSNDVVISS